MGILSNHVNSWFLHVVAKFEMEKIFQRELILVSQGIQCDKPSKQVYEALLHAVHKTVGQHIRKDEILFIDDKKKNVEAAIAFGLHGITFDRLKQPASLLLEHLKEFGVTL